MKVSEKSRERSRGLAVKTAVWVLASAVLVSVFALWVIGCGSDGEVGRGSGDSQGGKGDKEEVALTGVVPLEERHWRAVWVRSDRSNDPWLRGFSGHICGMDSRDGAGERVLVEGPQGVLRPLICPDGKTVIYSLRVGGASDPLKISMWAVDWERPEPRSLGEGFALDMKRDPGDGKVWVYAGVGLSRQGGIRMSRLVRFPLDAPSAVEDVWDVSAVTTDNVQFTNDGSKFVGMFPWPNGGIADVVGGRWEPTEEGCWPSLAPGDSGVSWVFDGRHRNVEILPPGREKYLVRINSAPGMEGYEVYHPRWTNDAAFFTCTGPYREGTGGMRVGEGGEGVEVYIGQFDATLTEVAAWHRVTDNGFGDFYPDVWIEGGEATKLDPEKLRAPRREAAVVETELRETWPGTDSGLIFQWENRRKVTGVVDGKQRSFQMTAKGRARYGAHGEMLTRGGYFVCAEGVGGEIAAAARAGEGFSVEALITPHSTQQEGLRNILSLSRDGQDRNFLLAQEGSGLVVFLRSMRAHGEAEKSRFDFGELEAGRTFHVLVTGGIGTLDCYVDGELFQSRRGIFDGFGNWIPHELIVGDEWGGNHNWDGGIEAVAMFGHHMDEGRAKHHYELATKLLEGRERVPRASVTARLMKAAAMPSLAGLGSYRRHLSAYVYGVEEVREGDPELGGKEIVVYHWTVMDKELSPGFPRVEGQMYPLLIEPMERYGHLMQESKDEIEDLDLLGAPIFLDVGN